MPSFACHALSLSLPLSVCLPLYRHPPPLSLSSLSLLPPFQLGDVYHHSQSRPAAPLEPLTRAQVGDQLVQDQRRLLQKSGSLEHVPKLCQSESCGVRKCQNVYAGCESVLEFCDNEFSLQKKLISVCVYSTLKKIEISDITAE